MGGRGSPGGVGGQFRPEGWHEVVGRVDRAGWRRGVGWRGRIVSFFFGAFPDAEVGLFAVFSRSFPVTLLLFFSSKHSSTRCVSVDGSLPHSRLTRTDSRPEPSQPVRTSSESASSAHAYCSAPPPGAVPGFSPNSPPLSLCPHGLLSATASLHQQAFMKGSVIPICLLSC